MTVYKKIFLTSIVVLISTCQTFSQEKFNAFGNMKLEKGRLDGKLEIIKNGKRINILNLNGSGKFDELLDFNASYLLTFSQEGYVTKKIAIETGYPASRNDNEESYPFEPFKFTVTLFKQYEGVNFVMFNQPVGKVMYSVEIDDFDYDKDYTKSIQENLDAIMEQVAEKEEEEEKLAKEAEKEAEAQRKEEEKLAKELAKEKEQEAEAKAEAEKEERELLEKEAKEKEKALAAAAAAEAKEEKEAEPEIVEEKKDPPPPITSKTSVKKEAPPTSPRKRYSPPPPSPPKKKGENIVVLHSYTVGEMGYPALGAYGFINFGDGAGRREISKEQFDEYAKQYH